MRALGIRCWKEKLALVVLESSPGIPSIVESWHGPIPQPLDSQRLDWVYQEVGDIIDRCSPGHVAVRITDAGAKVDQLRAEAEGVALIAAVHHKVIPVRFARQQMTHVLGASAAGAWGAYPRTDPFIKTFPGDERDAAMAARVALIKA